MREGLLNHLLQKEFFAEAQHGFLNGRSTVTQLLDFTENVLGNLIQGKSTDVIYLDLAKAFDKVDHSILLQKLHKTGIGGNLWNWIRSYPTGRSQSVRVGTRHSKWNAITSGVPQGSVLGPLLFLVMINDLPEVIQHSQVKLFADDTKIYRKVENKLDCEKLDTDLNSVYHWAEENRIKFNDGKFQLLRLGSGNPDYCYKTPGGNGIPANAVVKDLGVHISADGYLDEHITQIKNDCAAKASQILRSFFTREPWPMKNLFRALVLSKIDYCSQVWAPVTQCNLLKLECIQRSFLKKVNGFAQLSYRNRLGKIGLYSIQRRLERYRILYIFKIAIRMVPNPGIIVSFDTRKGYTVCSQTKPAVGARASYRDKNRVDYIFSHHGSKLFNMLPYDVKLTEWHPPRKQEPIMSAFKTELDKLLELIQDEPETAYRVGSNSLYEQVHCGRENDIGDR